MISDGDANLAALKCPQCGADLPHIQGHVVCQYCGSSLVMTGKGAGQRETPADTVVRGMRLKPFRMGDPQGTGLECFRMLVPVGWQMRGGVTWDLQNVGMPATVGFHLWNPYGIEAFEILPNMNFSGGGRMDRWITGGKKFGAEVRDPMDAQSAMKVLVIPRYRGDKESLHVVRIEHFPELAEAVDAGAKDGMGMRQGDGARARITYVLGEHPIEEEIFAVVEVWRVPMQTMFGGENVFWFVDYMLAFRAGQGKLEAHSDLFQVMVRSLKVNPNWKAAYEQVITQLAQAQIRHIRHVGQIGSMYAQMGAQVRQENMDSWYGRQDVSDRLSHDWSEVLRGVETYYDPYKGYEVEFPSRYDHAWVNSRGEYIITDDINFNPNIDTDSTLNWEQMVAR
jgi:DNA-directed RNA polymerase subunit RPC12/RpoP